MDLIGARDPAPRRLSSRGDPRGGLSSRGDPRRDPSRVRRLLDHADRGDARDPVAPAVELRDPALVDSADRVDLAAVIGGRRQRLESRGTEGRAEGGLAGCRKIGPTRTASAPASIAAAASGDGVGRDADAKRPGRGGADARERESVLAAAARRPLRRRTRCRTGDGRRAGPRGPSISRAAAASSSTSRSVASRSRRLTESPGASASCERSAPEPLVADGARGPSRRASLTARPRPAAARLPAARGRGRAGPRSRRRDGRVRGRR